MSKPPQMHMSITEQLRAHPYTMLTTSHEAPPKHGVNTFGVIPKAKKNYPRICMTLCLQPFSPQGDVIIKFNDRQPNFHDFRT